MSPRERYETPTSDELPAPPSTPGPRTDSCPFCGAPCVRGAAVESDTLCGRCASPLFPALRHRFDPSGRRMLRRVDKQTPVAISTHWASAATLAGIMQDLSLNGMSVLAPAELQLDQLVKIEAGSLRCVARVAHCSRHEGDLWLVGVEFVTLRFLGLQGNFVATQV